MSEHQHEHDEKAPPEPAPTQERAQGAGPPEDVGTRALSDALRVSFRFLKFAMVAMVVIYLLQGLFFVKPGEVRVKLCFGRPVKVSRGAGRGRGYVMDSESGWHIRWPWEDVITIPIGEQTLELKKEFWFGKEEMSELEKEARKEIGQQSTPAGLTVKTDGYLVTGDVNIVHVKLRVRYRVRYVPQKDEAGVLDYAFAVRSTSPQGEIVHGSRDLLERFVIASTIEAVGSMAVNDVILMEVDGVAMKEQRELLDVIKARIAKRLKEFQAKNGMSAGIVLTAVEPIEGQSPEMPAKVMPAFHQAQQAASKKAAMITQAKTAATLLKADAMSEADDITHEARGYKHRLVSLARADSDALLKLSKKYKQSRATARILRHWHYQRMMESLLGQAQGSFVIHRPAKGSRSQLRLMLSRPPGRAHGEEDEEEAHQD